MHQRQNLLKPYLVLINDEKKLSDNIKADREED